MWYGINREAIAAVLGTHRKTVVRWDRENSHPRWADLLVRIICQGELAPVHGDWDGWTINRKGELCSPENGIFTPGELRSWQARYAQIAALERELAIATERLERLAAELPPPWIGTLVAEINAGGDLVVKLAGAKPLPLGVSRKNTIS